MARPQLLAGCRGADVIRRIVAWLVRCYAFRRPPDFVIGGPENPYLRRWHLLKTRWLRVYVHQILRDDDDRALHDHPWRNATWVLETGYLEVTPSGRRELRAPGDLVVRRAEAAHRIELLENRDGAPLTAWSLFVTGRKTREWGFHCPRGWRHWRVFAENIVDETGQVHSRVGRGCE